MTLCGSDKPHPIKSCKECHKLHMRRMRDRQRTKEQRRQLEEQRKSEKRKEQDEIVAAKINRHCPACKMRYRVSPLQLNDHYNPLALTATQINWISNAARIFDMESEDLFTAQDFVEWMRPDLAGHSVKINEAAGVARQEGGGRSGTQATRHGLPFPLPMLDRRTA